MGLGHRSATPRREAWGARGDAGRARADTRTGPRVAQGSARAAAGHAFLAALSSVGSSRPHVTQEGALPAAFALKPRSRPSDECRPLCPPDSGPAAPAGTQCRTSPGVTHGPSLRPTATPFHEPALDHRGTGRAAVPRDTHTGREPSAGRVRDRRFKRKGSRHPVRPPQSRDEELCVFSPAKRGRRGR